MKKLLSLLLALFMVTGLAACGADDPAPPAEGDDPAVVDGDLAYLTEKGTIVIGYTLYKPMNYEDENGELTGFDTELAAMTAEKLGLTPEFVKINWDTKEIELNAKSIDCIWNGMTINAERKANMEVTNPYVKNAQVIVMRADNDYVDTASLIGKVVAAEKGSAGEEVVLEDENLSQAEYLKKDIQVNCLVEVKAGTADAAVLDLTLANTMTGEGTDYSDLVIVDRMGEEDYGVAFRKGSDVCAEVNRIFDEMMADGSLQALAEKYGLDLAQ